jgi:hypothetical protein
MVLSPLSKKMMTEEVSHLIDDSRLLVGAKLTVIANGADESVVGRSIIHAF